MKWIGLTGGIGAGKSSVAELLRQKSVLVIDADKISREALSSKSKIFPDLVRTFGEFILNESKEIDREKLAQLIFNNQKAKQQLEGLVHPYVQAEVLKLKKVYEAEGRDFVVYDVPLLFENNLQKQFDAIVVVTCEQDIQIQRVLARNPNWTKEQVLDRIKHQVSSEDKVKLADYTILNNGCIADLETKVDLLYKLLSKKSE